VCQELHSNSVSSLPAVPFHAAIRDIGKISEINIKHLVGHLTAHLMVQDLN
jgi:hypothetical protein